MKTLNNKNKFILGVLLIYIIWTIITLITKDYELIFDKVLSAGIIIFVYYLNKKHKFSWFALIINAIGVTLHHVKLYGNFYFGIGFDKWMHLIVPFALCFLVYRIIDNLTSSKNKLTTIILTMVVVFGLACLVEVVEFIGYSVLGQGEGHGLLLYGEADYGEYFNTSWDIICNLIGAVVGTIVAVVIKKLKFSSIK